MRFACLTLIVVLPACGSSGGGSALDASRSSNGGDTGGASVDSGAAEGGGTGGGGGSGGSGTVDGGGSGGSGGVGAPDARPADAASPGKASIEELVIPRLPGCDARQPFPHDPAVDQTNGVVYYADSDNSCVGKYDPETKQWAAWKTITPNAKPHGLTVGAMGHVFFTAQVGGFIGRADPTAGVITDEYPVGTDPHTPIWHMGSIWFTAQGGSQYGRLDPTNGSVTTWPTPTPRSAPYGIDDAPDGKLWIALFGTNKLGELDPANPETLTEHALPNVLSRPRRLVVDRQGRVFYSDYSRDKLGMFDPATKAFKEWDTPGAMGKPYGITLGPDSRIWYNDDGASLMVAFDPMTEESEVVPVATPGSVIRNIDTDYQRRRIWLALSGVGRLGVIQF